ncbi:MAG: selenocysteine-specific translation elongation factor [Planctomycetota bacterium]|nr:selenocysteine-specific translation elongation factor [Planctomycetota bacterium]
MSINQDTNPIFNVIIGTAGHIDHGKSALVKRLTGIDPDRLPEEQERGMTIDLGFAPLVLRGGQRIGIIDVPGHEKFVKNMVAGATSIDLVLLVVAADDGVMPQTREHLNIMRLLGIRHGLIVMNKIDVVERDMLDLVEEDIRAAVQGTFLENARTVRVSCITGEGIDGLLDALHELLKDTVPHGAEGVFRMPIQRVFSARGFGTIVTGVPIDGCLKVGDPVEVMPQGLRSRVRGLQAYKSDVDIIRSGHSAAVNLADIQHDLVQRGNVVASPGLLKPATTAEALLRYSPDHKGELRNRTPVRFHVGTAEVLGRIVLLEAQVMQPGEEGLAQFVAEEPFVAAYGDRFIIRLQSPMMTLGGGRIIACGTTRAKRLKPELNELLRLGVAAMDDPESRIEFATRRAGTAPASLPQIEAAAVVPRQIAESCLTRLIASGKLARLEESSRYVHSASIDTLAATLRETLAKLHAASRLAVGFSEAELRRRMPIDPELLRLVLNKSIERGAVARERDLYRLSAHKVVLTEEQRWLAAEAERVFEEAKYSPPSLEELAASLKTEPARLQSVINFLLQIGALVSVSPDIMFHSRTIESARTQLESMIAAGGELVTAAFRDAVGTSRKFVVPLLEHFDKIGLTVRDGNVRRLAPQSKRGRRGK